MLFNQENAVENRIPAPDARRIISSSLPRWELREEQLYRRFNTANWRTTVMAAAAVGFLAEAAYHHPRLILNYRSIEIFLTTSDAGGLTPKDFELARKIEQTVLWPQDSEGAPENRPKDWLRS